MEGKRPSTVIIFEQEGRDDDEKDFHLVRGQWKIK
jgi:hypothetical protein